MSKPGHKSLLKEAKNELESFKKKFKTICLSKQVTAWQTMEPLNEHWRSRILNINVKKEIVKLLENESMELKLLFNFMYSFKYPVPQKRWFLGSAHSTAFLRRQPCNAPVYSFHNFHTGLLSNCNQFNSVLNPETDGANVEIALNDTDVYMVFTTATKQVRLSMIGEDTKMIDIFDEPELFENLVPIKKYDAGPNKTWRKKEFELRDGKIYLDDKPVLIYLDGQKIENQKIVQWDVRHCLTDDFDVILLFETYFLAVGFMKEGKSGMVFECTEVGNSYPTGSFLISPNWKLVIRKSVSVDVVPECTVVPNFERLRNAHTELVQLCDEHPEWTCHNHSIEQREDIEAWRLTALKIFCRDFYLVFAAIINMNDDDLPSLSAKENIIRAVLKAAQNESRLNSCGTTSNYCCRNLKFMCRLFIMISVDWTNIERQKLGYFKEYSVILTHMFEMFVNMFKYGKRYTDWEEDSQKIMEKGAVKNYDRIALAPLEIYEKHNEKYSLGSEIETVSKSTIMNYFAYPETAHIAAELLVARPDVFLFDASSIPVPVALIKKYCEVFTKLGTPEMGALEKNYIAIIEIMEWQLLPTPTENTEKRNEKQKKSKKPEKKK